MDKRQQSVRSFSPVLRNERGQSLILALTVMFLLVFIGGIFVMLIARNIAGAQRSGEVLSAQYLAEAGIRYADHQLTYSEDGADWRPAPTFPEVVRAIAAGEDPGKVVPQQFQPNQRDPDCIWLMQGFSRYSYGKGRFLIRVTYEPREDDPISKFVKIESVGRMGVVDENDPTTWQNQQPIRLRKELVAYKPIAISDYARFVTNKDRRSGAVSLGTRDFTTSFGEDVIGGAPIRVNGDLVWHGKNYIWLNPDRGDTVDVAGDIMHSVYSADDPPAEGATLVIVNNIERTEQSSSAGFSTVPLPRSGDPPGYIPEIGSYRDGREGMDAGDRPRGISRLEPPLLDVVGTGSRLSRYRELTRNSGEWRTDSSGTWYNTGYYGWGDGIYISNHRDVQVESRGYTLRANWTQPGTQYWNGPYYIPPGVSIILHPYDLDNADGDNNIETGPDLVIVRDEQTRYVWRDKDGNPLPETGEQIIMPYPKNGVIFAEGNIRIKGTLPPGAHLTVASGATIYVEGNILKFPGLVDVDGDGQADVKDSAIALLASDYVCVNTTQFFAPFREVPFPGSGGQFFDISPASSFWFSFSFGVDPMAPVEQGGYGEVPVSLYVRHSAAPGGASYMNMLVNYPPTLQEVQSNAYYCFYDFMPITDPWTIPPEQKWVTSLQREYVYPLGDVAAYPHRDGTDPNPQAGYSYQQYEEWEHAVFPLWPLPPGSEYRLNAAAGVENTIGFQLDQSQSVPMSSQDYYLSRVAVQPADIRIEALIYAQNNSFFIIPGEWFNPDPTDTCTADGRKRDDRIKQKNLRPGGVNDKWPFYGEPLDVQITIYGAVSENLPAPIGDVGAWMEKWGWIPPNHGSSDEAADNTMAYRAALDPVQQGDDACRGLTFVYDGLLSHPAVWSASKQRFMGLRLDEYGRKLPLAPKLPVSPQTIYFGEPV